MRSHYTLVSLKGQHISSVFRLRSRVAPVVTQSQHSLFTNSIELFCTFYTQRVTHAAPQFWSKPAKWDALYTSWHWGAAKSARCSDRGQLRDRSPERAQCVCVCVCVCKQSACIRNRSLRGSGCSTSWTWHIMLRLVAGGRGKLSPTWRSGSHALLLTTQRQWRVRMSRPSCVHTAHPALLLCGL